MKFIANLLIVLLALYGAYALYETYAPAEWPSLETEPAVIQPLPPSKPDAAQPEISMKQPASTNSPINPRPKMEVHRIECLTCDGEGRLTWADTRGANHSYACPICNSRGFRELRVDAGKSICPDCKGWGRTEKLETRSGKGGAILERGRRGSLARPGIPGYKVSSSICRRCNFSGVIKTAGKLPSDATPGVQTPRSGR